MLKHVTLESLHIELGAKMVPFAGYNMPLKYVSETEEHKTVRNGVGVFDVSHMGEFWVSGKHALDCVQWVTGNDVSKLSDGKIQYSTLLNPNGGIVDDLLVYRFSEERFMLVVNASNIEKDWNWISQNNKFGATLENVSDNTGLLAVQGPKAIEVLQTLTNINLSEIAYYSFKVGEFAGVPNVIISATGYTGAGGFELYVDNSQLAKVWNKIFEVGQAWNIKPIGLGARDTLRLEMGFCLYGNDINDDTTPLEAGLGWITKLNAPNLAEEILLAQKERGVSKKLVGFEMLEKAIPRHGYGIFDANQNLIGEVTSGTMSPMLGKGIGLGYVTIENSNLENQIWIDIRGKKSPAKVVKLPFYKPN